MSTEPHKRRWFQLRLRTLLILVAVLAVPLAWLAPEQQVPQFELFEEKLSDLPREVQAKIFRENA